MNLNLTKPICFFDLETTGINISKDRVVEISILKVYPDGKEESKTWLVNPEMNIPAEVTAIHGIRNEDVADKLAVAADARSSRLWRSRKATARSKFTHDGCAGSATSSPSCLHSSSATAAVDA